MSATGASLSLSSLFLFLLLLLASTLTTPWASSDESFVYGVCSLANYTSGSTYESNINSLLTSLVNSATFTSYNNFTFPGAAAGDTVYGLFQCRGDLSNPVCAKCVTHAVSQVGTLCHDACCGALQLEGCFIKYDNATFLGVEDKTVVMKKCGPAMTYNSDSWTKRDAVLAYLVATGDGGYKPFRAWGSGNLQGVAQCVGDLSPRECQDCVTEATGRLRKECEASSRGDVFLGKCYARFTHGGDHSQPQSHGTIGNEN